MAPRWHTLCQPGADCLSARATFTVILRPPGFPRLPRTPRMRVVCSQHESAVEGEDTFAHPSAFEALKGFGRLVEGEGVGVDVTQAYSAVDGEARALRQ